MQALPAAITGSWFENRHHPARPNDARSAGRGDPGRRLQQGEREAGGGGKAGGAGHGAGPPDSGGGQRGARARGPTYLGTTACGACHAPALAQWKTTKHARALSALARIGRDKDPSCVGCHVTGYLQPGGPGRSPRRAKNFPTSGAKPATARGKAHLEAADKKQSTARVVPEAICRGCHTADVTNGEFDYDKFVKAIVGPGHGAPRAGGMTQEPALSAVYSPGLWIVAPATAPKPPVKSVVLSE